MGAPALRATKIIATLGPASWDKDGIAALARAGADMVRINCSHTATSDVAALCDRVRRTDESLGVLVDVQGPKLRTGRTGGQLDTGEQVLLVAEETGRSGFAVSFDPAVLGVRPGERVLLDDGRIELLAQSVASHGVYARVVRGGYVSPRKGVNLPDTMVGSSLLSEKDLADVAAAVSHGASWLALSFVQSPSDVTELRAAAGDAVRIIAKIERPQALGHLDGLCAVADGLMAARGDLGVELPYEQVPGVQREIVAAALRNGVISVCATEMLDSMVRSARPTRAEVTDVAAAVRDGFDAVMLSAETAVGEHPDHTVRTMSQICAEAEQDRIRSPFADLHPDRAAVSAAAASLAARTGARAIVALTTTGHSASLLAAVRPPVPVIAATPGIEIARMLRVRYGVRPLVVPRDPQIEAAGRDALRAAVAAGLLAPGDAVVLCASRVSPRSDADTLWVTKA